MARDKVTVQYPTSDSTDSVQILQTPVASTITAANGVVIENAFGCKDNTLTLVLNNTGAEAAITLKKGVYQNAILGDLALNVAGSATAVIKIENPSRFEQADGSLLIDFASGFAGTMYVFAKKAGLV